jgi:4-hydroxybenzoate polyprenyltransferase
MKEATRDIRQAPPEADVTGTEAEGAQTDGRLVLAVDLDGTLLRSDMLHETLWTALSHGRLPVGRCLRALARGPAALKAVLAEATEAEIDPASLPYDPRVLERIEAWRAEGGRAYLVTATNERIAARIAAHLGLFDGVFASSPESNLKGAAKADLLIREFGRGGYVYLGDSSADLPVWAAAAEAVTVGAGAGVRRSVDGLGHPATHIEAAGRPLEAFLRTLRPHQWLKNILVFVPILADPGYDGLALTDAIVAFVAMSLVASAGYVFNDLLDLSDDRSHPRKCARPFASGALSAATGTALAPVLLLLGLGLSLTVSPALGMIVLGYFILTMAYSIRLKRHSVIDICTLAALYTIRIIAGGIAIGVSLSVWLLAFSMFTFFALAAAKRLGELSDADAAGRTVSRRGYTLEDRRILSQMAIAAGYVGVLVLALYIDEPSVQERYGEHRMFWGICALLIFWISRLVLVANRGQMDDDPLIWSVRDRASQLTISAVGLLMALAIVL